MDIQRLTNAELIRLTEELATDIRTRTCDLIESLAEIDARKLYQDFHYISLFEYCIHRLRMSEAAAYRRIRAARAFQAYPPVKPLMRAGKLNLESLALLHPFLNDADAGKLVAEAAGKRIWEVERLVAPRRTEAPRRDHIRFIPASPAPAPPPLPASEADEPALFDPPPSPSIAPAPPASPPRIPQDVEHAPAVGSDRVVPPMAAVADPPPSPPPAPPPSSPPRRSKVWISFTADEGFFNLLKSAQAAMRHKYPNGRLDGVFRDALEALLRKKTPWAYLKSR